MEFRLDDRDQQQYGGPEWVSLDLDAMLDLRASQLVEIEQAIAPVELGDAVARRGAQGLRAHLWLARRQAGIKELFAGFDPLVLRLAARGTDEPAAEAGEGDVPPDGPTSEPASS